MKTTSRTEQKHYAFESAARCGARTKGNHGQPCRCPAIKGKARCRVHGGAKGSGAPRYNLNAFMGKQQVKPRLSREKLNSLFSTVRILSKNLSNYLATKRISILKKS
ncbi:hypothetical protein Lnau_2893 [Legionella nautarum]|uniref:Periplasmic glucans biosynthesis protein n=1 Tax=Legionella nautarum TaxID=45070 RepID=A0A0W0WLN7_9GAMM|nr:hypothetical protein [Legionella nautarum]KTD33245.1 hypothetical protein Lnau_2893 [Legionella nautarum]